VFEWNDGYCAYCGKDFSDEGEYCSEECEKKALDRLKATCEVCGEKIDFGKDVIHHIRYGPPEETVYVHTSCHAKIHHSNAHPDLKPIDKRPVKEKAQRRTKAMKEVEKWRENYKKRHSQRTQESCLVCGKPFTTGNPPITYRGVFAHAKCVEEEKKMTGRRTQLALDEFNRSVHMS
jgi:hypothetical protein